MNAFFGPGCAARAALAVVATLLAAVAGAQPAAWPAKTVRLVVTFPPGGSSDAAARIVAPRLAERLGQPVVVENLPGAGGGVGLAAVAKAAPDGHTIVLASAGGLTANPSLYRNLAYDPVRDFAPVTTFGTSPFVLIASPALGVGAARDLIALARAQPGRLTYASGGNGTAMHLSAELLKRTTGTFIVHIPYRGSGPAMLGLMAGETSLAVIDLATLRPQWKSDRLRIIAVFDRERSALAPEVPTLAESGVPGFEAAGWFAILAPAGTNADVVARLNREITALLRTPDVRERFQQAALEPLPSTPAELAVRMRGETEKWAKVIRESGAKID
ncbi:MAG: tripartite tricarboxylate transporter substrate binding protein [Burkholderiales bacterium]|nr:tripartite tricarboxylate transporter substrate binding protein [Burkholderiales bacterium]